MIQTYQPEHYAVVHAAAQDYAGFYEEEILYREMMGYPPAAHMLAVQIFSREEERGGRLAKMLAEAVKEYGIGPVKLQIIGPAPASISRINDIFRFVFYIKSAEYGKLIKAKDFLEEKIQSMQPLYETVQFDFDPMNTL